MKTCSVDGCSGQHLARGFCKPHYERFRRHGDPLGGRVTPGKPMAFLEKAARSSTDDCIPWPFSVDGGGYGKITVDSRLVGAPSETLRRAGQAQPSPSHLAAHAPGICHNPACINPRHLRWATPAENMADRMIDGTSNHGERHGNSILTDHQVAVIKRDIRHPSEIANDLGVSEATIRDVLAGRTWKHVN
ncbi:hypothetical protein [Pseudooceanicola atlanticus]|uniref:hypothetical protein n=1 Tax=Pseudooceanicola atlanticus TaxID=1461694 RepID=UPI0023576F90|nr:hypothetical protein [Pseudooceanicola atlanticus]